MRPARSTLVQELQNASLDHTYATGKRANALFLPWGLGHVSGWWWSLQVWRSSRRLARVRLQLKAARDVQEAQGEAHRPGRRAQFQAATIRDQHRKDAS